jgi:uncharacterized protein YoxC
MANIETDIIIKAIDQATAVLNNVKKSMGDVEKTVEDVSKQTKSATQSISDRATKNEKAFKNMRNYGSIAFGVLTTGVSVL